MNHETLWLDFSNRLASSLHDLLDKLLRATLGQPGPPKKPITKLCKPLSSFLAGETRHTNQSYMRVQFSDAPRDLDNAPYRIAPDLRARAACPEIVGQ